MTPERGRPQGEYNRVAAMAVKTDWGILRRATAPQSTVARIESGRFSPRPGTLKKSPTALTMAKIDAALKGWEPAKVLAGTATGLKCPACAAEHWADSER